MRAQASSDQSAFATPPAVKQPVLQRLYPNVYTLRHYLLSKLPDSSRSRRRRITQLGLPNPSHDATNARGVVDAELGKLLDSTLVGLCPKASSTTRDEAEIAINKDIGHFSQQLPVCATGSTFKPGYFLQSEVGTFALQ